MKVTQDSIAFIENVVKTGQSIGIDNVIIEPGMVRAIDDARTVVLFQNTDVPEMVFGSIGLNRINIFLSRIEAVKTRDNFSFDVEVGSAKDADGDEYEYGKSVIMKSDDTVIGYRCANPATIQAPEQINDNLVYRIQLNAETVSLLQKGQAVMGSETVTFIWDGENVSFELTDINSDKDSHDLADDVELLDEDATESFTHNYPVKTLLALFKQNPDGHLDIGTKGILSITVNGLDVYVLPQV